MATSGYGAAADHAALTGLTVGDPHPQYAYAGQGTLAARPAQPVRAGYTYFATDEGKLYRSDGGAWAVASTHVRIPHTFVVSGDVLLPAGDTNYIPPFFVPVPVGQTVTLAGIVSRINSGTSATVEVRKNGVAVTVNGAATSKTVTTTTSPDTPTTPPTFANNDAVALVVTAVAGSPKNMTVTLYFDYAA